MTGYSHMREKIVPQFMRVLHENGPTHISKISARTAEILGLTPQEAALRYQGRNANESRTEWQYQNAWVAAELKKAGMVTTNNRGVYELTDDGRRAMSWMEPITLQTIREAAKRRSHRI